MYATNQWPEGGGSSSSGVDEKRGLIQEEADEKTKERKEETRQAERSVHDMHIDTHPGSLHRETKKDEDGYYWLKHIIVKGGQGFHILTQSYNGPCGIIAIANVLILEKKIKIEPYITSKGTMGRDYEIGHRQIYENGEGHARGDKWIKKNDLCTLIIDYLLRLKDKAGRRRDERGGGDGREGDETRRDETSRRGEETSRRGEETSRRGEETSRRGDVESDMRYSDDNVDRCIKTLLDMDSGLDLNLRFDGCESFEFSDTILLFQLLGIGIYHGWIPDGEETQWAMKGMSYNDMMDRIVESSSDPPRVEEWGEERGERWEREEREERENENLMLVLSFYENSKSQITQTGIDMMKKALPAHNFVILFRNNHFSLLVKHQNLLFTLVTDEGYQRYSQIVWECLSVTGETDFYDGSFVPSVMLMDSSQETNYDIPSSQYYVTLSSPNRYSANPQRNSSPNRKKKTPINRITRSETANTKCTQCTIQ